MSFPNTLQDLFASLPPHHFQYLDVRTHNIEIYSFLSLSLPLSLFLDLDQHDTDTGFKVKSKLAEEKKKPERYVNVSRQFRLYDFIHHVARTCGIENQTKIEIKGQFHGSYRFSFVENISFFFELKV